MIAMGKPLSGGKEIEKDLQYGKLRESSTQDMYDARTELDVIIDCIDTLFKRNLALEERCAKLESFGNHILAQDDNGQNQKKTLSDLANLFGVDSSVPFNPHALESSLSDYSDGQSSTEWIRAIRDDDV